jgi:hypothetical protein
MGTHRRTAMTVTVGLIVLASVLWTPLAGATPPQPFTRIALTTTFVPTVNHTADGNTFYDFVITYTFTYTDTNTSNTASGTGIGTGSFVVHPDGSGRVAFDSVETGNSLCGISGTSTYRVVADFTGFPTPAFLSSGSFTTTDQGSATNTGFHANGMYTANLAVAAGSGTYHCT